MADALSRRQKLSIAAGAFWFSLFGVLMGGVSWELAATGPNPYHAIIPPLLWLAVGMLYACQWLVKSLKRQEERSFACMERQHKTLGDALTLIDKQKALIADQAETIRAFSTIALCRPPVPGLYQIGDIRAIWDGKTWSWPKIESAGDS